jgi:hypothetical protein
MKNRKSVYSGRLGFVMLFLSVLSGLLAGGCIQSLLGDIETPSEGMGRLSVLITGPEYSGSGAASTTRTMLAMNPIFTRYELQVTRDNQTTTYQSPANLFQLDLPLGTYSITAVGFSEDKPAARIEGVPVSITSGNPPPTTLSLKAYMEPAVYGTLQYSLAWDSVGQIPAQAELFIEQYSNNDTPEDFSDDSWNPLSISLMDESVTAGSQHSSILLIQRISGLVKQSGSLDLPPGEYRLTTTVTMDNPYPPVSRVDIAHIFSNLITPAAFFYGAGDLIVTNPGTDTGSGFITSFNFAETPSAASIIASSPGPDGTRLIMVTVPPDTNLTRLTPVVECAPGASVTSPPPDIGPDGQPIWSRGDYSRPTIWVAKGQNGVTQQYTVVAAEPAETDCLITDLAFRETGERSAPVINQDAAPATIDVTVPNGTNVAALTSVFSYVGAKVEHVVAGNPTPLSGIIDFSSSQDFWVYAKNGASKLYRVTVTEALNGDAEISRIVIDGYPDRIGVFAPAGAPAGPNITITLPYGTSLSNLKPLITYKGALSPASGLQQNFSTSETNPVSYTVTSADGRTVKTYNVTVKTESADTDTGIFDFVVTNVPKAQVVIGLKPRADGKIPIVVRVPYATSPFISPQPADGPKTDLQQLAYQITLSKGGAGTLPSSLSAPGPSWAWVGSSPASAAIPFNNQNDYQEAVFTRKSQGGNTQDYVVVAARDVQYYYVKATGNDTDPDQNNGGSESTPFKTLAYAVYQAVRHSVDHIYVIGTLNDTTEGGAWEDTSTAVVGNSNNGFHPSGPSSTGGGVSVFNLIGAGRDGGNAYRIFIAGAGSNAVLQGAAGKRVISITGGAHITFENITIRDGGGASYGGNGGGVYLGGNSTVIWKSGVISGNRAASGGGVYVDDSEFDLRTGSVNGNTAAGNTVSVAANDISIQGGGGVYVNGDSLFWLASGDISNNTTSGSGGGVLVRGSVIPNNPNTDTFPYNFIMSAGTITGNVSRGSVWPHGGGGIYVAKGTFQMLNGQISENQSTRQGGGVFVWSRSLFLMDGNSSVVNNQGVGSSKAICTRGITTMYGNARADKVYIWNYAKGAWNNGQGDEFTLAEGARIGDLELAFADDPQDNRNYVNIVRTYRKGSQFFTSGTDPITVIGMESRLTSSGSFDKNATVAGDWLGKYIIRNGGNPIPAADTAVLTRFPLSSYIYGGSNPISLSSYKLDNTGRLAVK